MTSVLGKNDAQELLGYLKNIQSYERQYHTSESATIAMISGLFIFIAGLVDYNISVFAGFSPHAIPWFAGVAGALISRQIISSQPLLFENDQYETEIVRASASKFEIILTIISMLFTFVVAFININLIMPYVGLASGSFNLIPYIRNSNKPGNGSKNLIMALSFFITSAIILILGFGVDKIFFNYAGLIFGLLVGSTAFYIGYKIRLDVIEFSKQNGVSPIKEGSD